MTEQEQIKAIKQIIDERVETTLGQVQGRHGNVIKTVDTIIIARDIVDAGYGDVSEYKAEIERLRQEVRDTDKMARNTIEQYKNNYDNAFERLKAQEREIERLKAENKSQERENDFLKYCQCLTHGIDGSNHIKKAKIDVLNKAKERAVGLAAIETYHICNLIDELIEEVKNEQKD